MSCVPCPVSLCPISHIPNPDPVSLSAHQAIAPCLQACQKAGSDARKAAQEAHRGSSGGSCSGGVSWSENPLPGMLGCSDAIVSVPISSPCSHTRAEMNHPPSPEHPQALKPRCSSPSVPPFLSIRGGIADAVGSHRIQAPDKEQSQEELGGEGS